MAALALAGCLGDDDSTDEGTETDTDDAMADGTGDDTGSDDGSGDDGDTEESTAELPDNAYTGPSEDDPEPVQVVGNWYAAITNNDVDEAEAHEHSAYPWGGFSLDELETMVWFDDLSLELVDEDIEQEEIEDLSMFSLATGRSQEQILEAAEGGANALVSVQGTGEEDGETSERDADHLLLEEEGELRVAL